MCGDTQGVSYARLHSVTYKHRGNFSFILREEAMNTISQSR